MILRSRARPQTLLQAIRTPHLPSPRQHARTALTVKTLTRHAEFDANGVPGFLSARAYKITYPEYQEYLLQYLNRHLQATIDDSASPVVLIGKYHHDKSNAAIFNHASMAYNNEFFFRTLASEQTQPRDALLEDIKSSFGTIEELRTSMLENADAMFGNGFVWLMRQRNNGTLRLLNTYNAGSPLPEAHKNTLRQEGYDVNTVSQSEKWNNQLRSRQLLQSHAGSFGNDSSRSSASMTPNALDADPLLCVNVWEHMWLMDYGLVNKRTGAPAKQTYLSAWWQRIDWQAVQNRLAEVDNMPRNAARPRALGLGIADIAHSSMNKARY